MASIVDSCFWTPYWFMHRELHTFVKIRYYSAFEMPGKMKRTCNFDKFLNLLVYVWVTHLSLFHTEAASTHKTFSMRSNGLLCVMRSFQHFFCSTMEKIDPDFNDFHANLIHDNLTVFWWGKMCIANCRLNKRILKRLGTFSGIFLNRNHLETEHITL